MTDTELQAQSAVLDGEWDYLLLTDGGRFDIFQEVYEAHLSGDLEPVFNGGHTFTATWFADHFSKSYDMPLFHGGHPIWSFSTNPAGYDEREHFDHVPEWREYAWDEEAQVCAPDAVNSLVREYDPDRAVIRYLQPHNPYRTLRDVNTASDAQQYSTADLRDAYTDNYDWVLEAIADLADTLEGDVVVTSDHGQCFGDCGQYLHSPAHASHDHLTTVPWFRLECS